MQALIAYSIVAAAMLYSAWLFVPRAMRGWLLASIKAIVPASRRGLIVRLENASEDAGCRSCKGCAADAKVSSPAIKTVEFHRRQAAGLKD